MTPKAPNNGMVPGVWYALLRKPGSLPCLFSSRQDAIDNMDTDEYFVKVHVRPASLRDLLRGRKWEALQKKKPRRGASIKVGGLGLLRAELKRMAPEMRRRFEAAIVAEIKASEVAFQKGGRRADAPRVRR